ncbi:uncharacterized protein LOC114404453 [Glycine soja]|uniref:uncharacterized protein LOC114404453 n=1 Tax=Glycine soja TaxID=3848 RepID=UPI00103EC035|nr:uncharacterized protein LOC114404453 [Glycine soja]
MQMVDKGRGGGCRTFNRGRRRGLSLGAPITTNPSTSSIHVSTSESMIHVIAPTPNTLPTAQDQPNPTFVRESIPITPVRDASPSAPDDSLTLEYPSDPNCFNQHMSVLISYQISLLITEKFDEPAASWLKKEYRWHPQEERAIRAIFETKGSCILKSAMNKIRNGQDKGKWITDNVRAALDEHWGSTDFLNKSSTAKANRSIDRGALAYYGEPYLLQLTLKAEEGTSTQDSLYTATSVNDNEIYLNVVGAPNYKGNMYGLGTLSKQFSCSKSAPSTSIAPVEDQIKEMCETINKLNAELLAKANKEKTLEEKMLQLMENHDHQSQEMRQQMQEQNEQIRQQNEQL